MRSALAEQTKERVLLEKELDSLVDKQRAAQREKEAQLERVREVQAELATATPSRLLTRFLQDRVESDDYRKRLGVLALVRRDFHTISNYLAEQNRELEECKSIEDEERDDAVRINRIVLYIDDLDRCAPKTVVEVLQAVHLLLAFPLFVVVVAVDVRWVSRSLTKQYPDLLEAAEGGAWDGANPRDYLEKIFQVPFWIEPLDQGASRRMLHGLVGRFTSVDGERASISHAVTTLPPSGARDDSPGRPQAPMISPTSLPASGPPADLNPESLDLQRIELDFMEQLSPIVGRTPRAVKRFVNVYRLIKASVRDLRPFLDQSGPFPSYRIVMFLLAVETGLPSLAEPLLAAIAEPRGQPNDSRTLADILQLPAFGRAPDELARLEAWRRQQNDAWDSVPVQTLAAWADRVARFSFRLRGHSEKPAPADFVTPAATFSNVT
jgi:hypothetical protein